MSYQLTPTIVIIGRPNVGKSTLFNRLTNSRNAIVADMPGVTRDRQYGRGYFQQQDFIVVDTGGLGSLPSTDAQSQDLQAMTETQVYQAIEEADHLLLLVDAKSGLTGQDQELVNQLRKQQRPFHLLINKCDRLEAIEAQADFYQLGVEHMFPIAAASGRGIADVLATLFPSDTTDHSIEHTSDSNQCLTEHNLQQQPTPATTASSETAVQTEQNPIKKPIKIALLGRPNVGKSTLTNSLLGEQRVMVYDGPGTTRDSIAIPYTRHQQDYILIDTAGIRRRARVDQALEKFSIIKSLQAMQQADLCICVIDAAIGLHEQDLRLLQQAVLHAKSIVVAFNKWDCLDQAQRQRFQDEAERRLSFIKFARRYHISALHGSGLGELYRAIHEAQNALQQDFNTGMLSKLLEKALAKHQPPLANGRRIRLRYAHLGGRHPMTIIVHGKQVARLAGSYKRYLSSYFQKQLKLTGVPLHLTFMNDHNPYVTVTEN